MQPAERADFGDAPKDCARHRMLPRLLIAGGFALAGSLLFGVGTASATEDDSSEGLLSTLTDSATEPLTTVTELPDVVSDAVKLVELESVSRDDHNADENADVDEVDGADVLHSDDADAAGSELAEPARSQAGETGEAVEAVVAGQSAPHRALDAVVLDVAPRHLPITELGGPVQTTIEPVVALAEPVVRLAEPVLELVDPALQVVEPVVRPVVGATDPVLREVADLLTPVSAIVAPVTDTVVATITPVIEPIAPVISPVLEPVIEPLGEAGRGSQLLIPHPVPARTGAEADVLSAGHVERDSILPTTQRTDAALFDGSAPAAFHYSLDASPDDQPSPSDSREGHRPSQLPTPLAGLVGLQAGAPGAVTSVDQTGSMSHSMLPEEAVQRARFISAAAYGRSVEGLSQREATNPPVSPD